VRRPVSRAGRVRPRYGRMAVLAASLGVVLVSGLANLGVLASGSAVADEAGRPASYTSGTHSGTGSANSSNTPPDTPTSAPTTTPSSSPNAGPPPTGLHRSNAAAQPALPASSGSGRRVVFSQHLQRVWLVGADDQVARTYLVSGSTTDNLQPGTYAIETRERHAIGIDNSGTMQYFDIFTAGPTGAAIGFHSIPVKNGHLVQTTAQLGTPQSHGCIRQWMPDAIALWRFAPIGTKVVVVA
jgi:lipoprotein-anchoring transpeptidase ErfK/SrfK